MSKKENRIKVGTYLDKDLYQRLRVLSEKTKVPLSKLFDEAILDLITKRS